MIWTVVPVVILAAIGAFVFYELPGIADAPAAAAADSDDDHGRGPPVLLALPLPERRGLDRHDGRAGRRGRARATSSASTTTSTTRWWVPDLGGKFDAIPGRVNKTWFKAPAGTYVARCAELCGIQHALMDAHRRRRAARPVRRSSSRSALANPSGAAARQGGVAGRLPDVPPARPRLHRAGARRQPAARATAKRIDDAAAQRPGADAGRRQQLDERADRRARSRTRSSSRRREADASGGERRERPALPRRLAPRPGHVVADDRRPQADRDPLPLDVARLLRGRRRPRAAHAHAARDAERALPDEETRTTRCSRSTARR